MPIQSQNPEKFKNLTTLQKMSIELEDLKKEIKYLEEKTKRLKEENKYLEEETKRLKEEIAKKEELKKN